MSNNTKLMDTETGGEQTQYEGTHTFVDAPTRQGGTLGDLSERTVDHKSHNKASNAPNTQGITPAEKIRYGQSLQEGGAGGKTEGLGDASVEGGFGGTEALKEGSDSFAKERRVQGYGTSSEQRRDIGA